MSNNNSNDDNTKVSTGQELFFNAIANKVISYIDQKDQEIESLHQRINYLESCLGNSNDWSTCTECGDWEHNDWLVVCDRCGDPYCETCGREEDMIEYLEGRYLCLHCANM